MKKLLLSVFVAAFFVLSGCSADSFLGSDSEYVVDVGGDNHNVGGDNHNVGGDNHNVGGDNHNVSGN